MSVLIKKTKAFDIRSYYIIFLECGLIATLLTFITLTNIDIKPADQSFTIPQTQQEIIKMKDMAITRQEKTAVPPLPPRVPIEVPNDQIIADQEINFSSELNMDEALTLPPPETAGAEGKREVEEKIFVAVEQQPVLIGGMESINKKVVYPKKAMYAGIQGLVVVQFVVDKDGTVKDPVVIRGIGGGCDEEALRVVKDARFHPGRQRGQAVKVRYSIPIRFILKH